MAQHTPGPWSVGIGLYANRLWSSAARPIVNLCSMGTAPAEYDPEAQANASLIAAAPDLLAALKDMLNGWRYIRQHHGDLYGVGWDRCEDAARAAIDRAEQG